VIHPHQTGRVFFALLLILPFPVAYSLAPVIVTPIDMNCTWQATFGSYKNQLVENQNGIFMAYYWLYNPRPWQGYWNLLRTEDMGETFEVVYTPPLQGSCVPCVETDEDGNVHLVSSYLQGGNQPFYYHRFLADEGYHDPWIFEHGGDCRSEKYTVFLDQDSSRLYLFNNQGVLITFDATTGERLSRRIYAYSSGGKAFIQYPHVYVENGTIYHAWTTQRWTGGGDYVYYNIHVVKSPDGGITWQLLNGTRLDIPFVPDDTGPVPGIVEEFELLEHTWLNSLMVKDGKAHLCYFSNRGGNTYVYVRIDLQTGQIDRRFEPRGETITPSGNGGFFATAPDQPLYLVSTNKSHIVALVSEDNGESWHDLAVGPRMQSGYDSWGVEYVTGCREVTGAGIIGSFTLHHSDATHSAYFFRIPLDGEGPASHTTRFTVKPDLISMEQGESSLSRVTIVSDGSDGQMELEAGEPEGIEVSFHPQSGEGNFSSTVHLSVGEETSTGTYYIPVVASWGGESLNFTFQVMVTQPPPEPDFEIAVEPSTLNLGPGESDTVGITLNPLNGFADYWSLKVAGLPSGVQASFDPSWGREPYASYLTVSAGDAPPGRYVLNITGSGGGQVHGYDLELTIGEPIFLALAVFVIMAFGRMFREAM